MYDKPLNELTEFIMSEVRDNLLDESTFSFESDPMVVLSDYMTETNDLSKCKAIRFDLLAENVKTFINGLPRITAYSVKESITLPKTFKECRIVLETRNGSFLVEQLDVDMLSIVKLVGKSFGTLKECKLSKDIADSFGTDESEVEARFDDLQSEYPDLPSEDIWQRVKDEYEQGLEEAKKLPDDYTGELKAGDSINGRNIIAVSPEEDNGQYVLASWKEGKEYAVWLWDTKRGGFLSGNYFDNEADAKKKFADRSGLELEECGNINNEDSVEEAIKDSDEEYEGEKYEIWYEAPKGYYAKHPEIAKNYYDTADEAKEHAGLELSGFMEEGKLPKNVNKDADGSISELTESFSIYDLNTMDVVCEKGEGMHFSSQSLAESYAKKTGLKEYKIIKLADEVINEKTKAQSRGNAIFQSDSSKVTDNKDHFPINNAAQARNALARVAQYKSAPEWYKGSLSALQAKVRNTVKKEFPSIEVTDVKESKNFKELAEKLMVVKHLKEKATLSDKHKSFIESVEAINLTESERKEVMAEYTKLERMVAGKC